MRMSLFFFLLPLFIAVSVLGDALIETPNQISLGDDLQRKIVRRATSNSQSDSVFVFYTEEESLSKPKIMTIRFSVGSPSNPTLSLFPTVYSSPQFVASGSHPTVTIDSTTIHLAYLDTASRLMYCNSTDGAVWSAPRVIALNASTPSIDIENGMVHFAWSSRDSLYYRRLMNDTLSTLVPFGPVTKGDYQLTTPLYTSYGKKAVALVRTWQNTFSLYLSLDYGNTWRTVIRDSLGHHARISLGTQYKLHTLSSFHNFIPLVFQNTRGAICG